MSSGSDSENASSTAGHNGFLPHHVMPSLTMATSSTSLSTFAPLIQVTPGAVLGQASATVQSL